jgi:glycosyltransferase involved in cell wall biosynthesis
MLKNSPLISIITVCYNSSSTIRSTIESVINQTYKNIEYIIIDGNSKDDTNNIIKSYISNILFSDIIFKYISEDDNGISSAFNKAVDLASGDYLLFLNSDDYFFDNFVLENSVKLFRSKCEIYCGSIFSESQNKILSPKISKNKIEYDIMHPATFIGSQVFSKVGYFDESLKIAMDFDFFLRSRNLLIKFEIINVVVSYFSDNGISSVDINRVMRENNIVRDKHDNYNFLHKFYFFLGAIRIKLLNNIKLK